MFACFRCEINIPANKVNCGESYLLFSSVLCVLFVVVVFVCCVIVYVSFVVVLVIVVAMLLVVVVVMVMAVVVVSVAAAVVFVAVACVLCRMKVFVGTFVRPWLKALFCVSLSVEYAVTLRLLLVIDCVHVMLVKVRETESCNCGLSLPDRARPDL